MTLIADFRWLAWAFNWAYAAFHHLSEILLNPDACLHTVHDWHLNVQDYGREVGLMVIHHYIDSLLAVCRRDYHVKMGTQTLREALKKERVVISEETDAFNAGVVLFVSLFFMPPWDTFTKCLSDCRELFDLSQLLHFLIDLLDCLLSFLYLLLAFLLTVVWRGVILIDLLCDMAQRKKTLVV